MALKLIKVLENGNKIYEHKLFGLYVAIAPDFLDFYALNLHKEAF